MCPHGREHYSYCPHCMGWNDIPKCEHCGGILGVRQDLTVGCLNGCREQREVED